VYRNSLDKCVEVFQADKRENWYQLKDKVKSIMESEAKANDEALATKVVRVALCPENSSFSSGSDVSPNKRYIYTLA